MVTYEIWILGFEENGNVNDFEKLIATFTEEEQAKWFMENYPFEKPKETPRANAVLEKVADYNCVDVLMETEL